MMAGLFDFIGCPPAVEASSDESTNADGKKNNYDITAEVSSQFAALADDVNLELGLSIGGGCSDCGYSSSFVSSFVSPDYLMDNGLNLLRGVTKNKAVSKYRWMASNEKGYRLVKVTKDGMLIGRKVDLFTHNSYETLAQTLEDMFFQKEAAGRLNLLDCKSEFVLTYQDKNDNSMLLGVVPWRIFLISVKRLRIMRNSISNNHGDYKRAIESPTIQEKRTRRNSTGV